MPSWDSIGKDYYNTANNKAKPSPKVRQLAAKIVGNKKGKEAAKAIYDWVAQNIKYIYLPLNIESGFVPNTADDIIENGFGDCKDHVTLMQALLSSQRIKSEPVLVGWNNSFKELPLSNPTQFNHVIIYLPDYNLYANPTSDASPFGSLDVFLSGKFVLHAGEKPRTGRTPTHQFSDNGYVADNNIQLTKNGSLITKGDIRINGFAEGIARKLISGSREELKKIIKQILAGSYEGGYGSISPTTDVIENHINLDLEWQSPNTVEMTDTIYFKVPRGIDFFDIQYINRILQINKHSNIVLIASQLTWNYHIKIPENYQIKSIPKERFIQNKYGSYTVTYHEDHNDIIIKRSLKINKDIFTGEEFRQLKIVLNEARRDANSTIVLGKR